MKSWPVKTVCRPSARFVSLLHKLAPEFKFPYSPKDAWDALKWAAANVKSWEADPSVGFVVGGMPAGANLASAVVHLAQGRKPVAPH